MAIGLSTRSRSRRGIRVLIYPIVLMVGWMYPFIVNAAQDAGGVEQFRDWALACESTVGESTVGESTAGATTACRIYQKLALKDGMAPILVVSVMAPTSGAPQLRLTVPLGVSLAQGVELNTDRGENRKATYTRCTRNGCEANLNLDASLLSAFQRGHRATVFIHHASRKRIGIPVSLSGFTNAHRRLVDGSP